jgi:ribosomal protein S18 acetylase RimI-like enzyme
MAQLVMYRPIGANPLPEESAVPVRAATRADGPQMAAVLGAAFPEMKWDEARVHADLTDATDVPVTFVIEERGKIVATASVRYNPKFPDSGYVHWVGVDPAHRGKQLGTVVMAKVMRRFLADGYKTVILETDDFRLPAIASYLGQGFIPHYTETDHEERWSKVFEQLAQSRRTTKGK